MGDANRADLLRAKLFFCTALLLMRVLADFIRLLFAAAICRLCKFVMPGLDFLFAANARCWAARTRLFAFLVCGPMPPDGLSAAVDVPGLAGVVWVPLFIVPVPGLHGL